jgi:hypothetical protein
MVKYITGSNFLQEIKPTIVASSANLPSSISCSNKFVYPLLAMVLILKINFMNELKFIIYYQSISNIGVDAIVNKNMANAYINMRKVQ